MYEIHSGGAIGADSMFDKYAPNFAKVIHHSFAGHKINGGLQGTKVIHSDDELLSLLTEYRQCCRALGRYPSTSGYVQKLCIRNYFQVTNAELIVAIVQNISDYQKCICDGGTGYAVMYAKILEKCILVFNQTDNLWYYSHKGTELRLSKSQNPTWAMVSYCNIAGIGTREINSNGINAIRGFFADSILETPKTTVVNIRKEKCDIYIGRGSKWGNPFPMKDKSEAERNRTCEEYIAWFWTQPQLINSIHELKGKVLGCYCKPLRCHGDFLAELANR